VAEDKVNRKQYNLWFDIEDIEWVNEMTNKYPFHVSTNEFLRQVIKTMRFEYENEGSKREPDFFVYINGKYR